MAVVKILSVSVLAAHAAKYREFIFPSKSNFICHCRNDYIAALKGIYYE